LAKFVSFLIDMGSNPAEAGHCVTTVGKLFTPAVPSGAEGRPKQLTPRIAGTSLLKRRKVVYLCRLSSTQPFILNWWINQVPTGHGRGEGGSAASAG